MSNEIKMSELFKSGLCLVVRGGHIYNRYDDLTQEQANAFEDVILAYDRLVEENKRLRDTMGRLISSSVSFQNLDEMDNTLDSDDIASIEAKFNDELIIADKLLSDLDGEK